MTSLEGDDWNRTAEEVRLLQENIDTLFLIVFGSAIYFMHCGFAFLETGTIRTKNATNTVMKNLMDSCIGACVYWAIGFGCAFGKGNSFIGGSYFFFESYSPQYYAFFFFEFTFAAACTSIISGAMAERTTFCAYLLYSAAVTGFVYPVISRWAWYENGWLALGPDIPGVRYQDFAGSGVVHVTGGTIALVGAAFLGLRLGRYDETGRRQSIEETTVMNAALGGYILLFGFLSFNGGSALTLSKRGDNVIVARSVINTVLSFSAGGVATMVASRLTSSTKQWSFLTTLNGCLTGAVAICAGCDVIPPWAAVITGVVAAPTCLGWRWVVAKLGVDDPLDATAVHLGGGLWGLIAVTLFNRETGICFQFSKLSFVVLSSSCVGPLCSLSLCSDHFTISDFFEFLIWTRRLVSTWLSMGKLRTHGSWIVISPTIVHVTVI